MSNREEQGVISHVFENHLQTGIAIIILSFVGWVGYTVSDNSKVTVQLKERIIYLERSLNEKMADRFTGQEGADLARRVSILEAKFELVAAEQQRRTEVIERMREQLKGMKK